MERKLKIDFDDNNVLESVMYIFVSEFNLRPNVLRVDIGGDGSGFMLVSVVGQKEDILRGVIRIRDMGYQVRELNGHIFHDYDRCWDCGACVSLCPTGSIYYEKEIMKVRLNTDTCIACGACIDACSVKAIQLEL